MDYRRLRRRPLRPPSVAGAVVTTDAILLADLTCPAGDGITIVGDVTIDPRGHRLSGQGGQGTAIWVRNESSPTIKNGAITAWGTGLSYGVPDDFLSTSGAATVSSVRFSSTSTGVQASGPISRSTAGFVIKNSRFEHNGYGIQGLFTGPIAVTGTTFSNNGSGIQVDTGSVDVRFAKFDGNSVGFSCVEASCTVRNSYLSGNQTALSARTFGMAASGHVFTGKGIGFDAYATLGNVISYNAFTGNTTGLNLTAGGGTVTRNSFTGNGAGLTAVGAEYPFSTTVDSNLLTRNGSGIYIEDQGISLKGNTSNKNAEWGIYAPQSTDLGGNRASGNGNSPQCVGVVC